jgi:aromatase
MSKLPGYTQNTVVILRDFDTVFDLTNDIELWPQLFTEYKEAKVLERDGNKVTFELTTHPEGERPSRTWVSTRIIDKPGKKAEAQRVKQAFPFKTMQIYWNYEALPQNVGTVMTWIQKFEPTEDCEWSVEKLQAFLNNNTLHQMQAIKERVEAWPVPKAEACAVR